MDKFTNIHAFVSVVENHSFSAASNQTEISKSLLSRRVSALESSLGVQLLQRTTRRLSMTESGRQFYQRAKRLLDDLTDAENEISEDHSALKGRIKLAAPHSFGLKHLPETISDFINQHPEVDIHLDLNDREVNLIDDNIDIALRVANLEDSSLIARRLSTIRHITCASPDYIKKYGEPIHPNDLNHGHWGMHYSNIAVRDQWRFVDENKQTLFAKPKIRLHANNGEVLATAAANGLGITKAPTFILHELINEKRLIPILQNYQSFTSGLYALYPPGRLIPKRVRMLSDHLATQFGEKPYWDDCLTTKK